MKDILQDIVQHTHSLGFIELVKIVGDDKSTSMDAMAEDRSVVVKADFKNPVAEMQGTFGMPNLGKLDILLKLPVYKDSAKITVNTQDRNGEVVPVGLHFENDSKDFKNDYRFMNSEIVNEKLKSVKFRGVNWHVNIKPTMPDILRLNFQAQANSEEQVFTVSTDGDTIKFNFGDASSHAGEFVFAKGIEGALSKSWSWPVAQVTQILKLAENNTCEMSFSDDGALQITLDSGIGNYQYILPAQTK
tara:strand:+ start:2286 stop:3023 length:738 start_codon:yes stop_codon:yes gene_type:complete